MESKIPKEEKPVQVKRSDWVICKADKGKVIGYVKRVAKNMEWADVEWRCPSLGNWVKRMPTSSLEVVTTIAVDFSRFVGEVTDLTRKKELED